MSPLSFNSNKLYKLDLSRKNSLKTGVTNVFTLPETENLQTFFSIRPILNRVKYAPIGCDFGPIALPFYYRHRFYYNGYI